ncbi:MAG: hypothetical protein H6727_12710 [Myxococcales bacterium]|nr:hypothetical protein [Myxococcales bacterium]
MHHQTSSVWPYQITMNGLLALLHIGLYLFFGMWLYEDHGGEAFFVHAAFSSITLVAYGYYIRARRQSAQLPLRQLDRIVFVGVLLFNILFLSMSYGGYWLSPSLFDAALEYGLTLIVLLSGGLVGVLLNFYIGFLEKRQKLPSE